MVPDVSTTVVGIVGLSVVVGMLTPTSLSTPSASRSMCATEKSWPSPVLTALGATTPSAGALSLGPIPSEPSGGVLGDKGPVDLKMSVALTTIRASAAASL